MKQQLSLITGQEPKVSSLWSESDLRAQESQFVYREMDEVPVQLVDPADALSWNLSQLEDMQGRLRFMMSEIRSMIRR